MLTKTRPMFIKAIDPAAGDQGVVEMVVATYDVDSWGDQILPGAFADTLAEWKARGDPIPFIWSHRIEDPLMHIGYCLDVAEVPADLAIGAPAGLWMKAQLDMDEPIARKVYNLLKGRRVTQGSFQYDVTEGGQVTKDGETVYELRKLKLYEGGPCLIGMNQETELLNVKTFQAIAADVKAGRVLSTANETLLRDAHEAIGTVLSTLEDSGGKARVANSHMDDANDEPSDPNAAVPGKPVKEEEPIAANSEEPIDQDIASLDALDRSLALTGLGLTE